MLLGKVNKKGNFCSMNKVFLCVLKLKKKFELRKFKKNEGNCTEYLQFNYVYMDDEYRN